MEKTLEEEIKKHSLSPVNEEENESEEYSDENLNNELDQKEDENDEKEKDNEGNVLSQDELSKLIEELSNNSENEKKKTKREYFNSLLLKRIPSNLIKGKRKKIFELLQSYKEPIIEKLKKRGENDSQLKEITRDSIAFVFDKILSMEVSE